MKNLFSHSFTNHGKIKAQLAIEYLERVLHSLSNQHSHENSALEAMAPITDKIPSEQERTWLEVVEEEVYTYLYLLLDNLQHVFL